MKLNSPYWSPDTVNKKTTWDRNVNTITSLLQLMMTYSKQVPGRDQGGIVWTGQSRVKPTRFPSVGGRTVEAPASCFGGEGVRDCREMAGSNGREMHSLHRARAVDGGYLAASLFLGFIHWKQWGNFDWMTMIGSIYPWFKKNLLRKNNKILLFIHYG